jgi:outer membrane protein assembly factor BamB
MARAADESANWPHWRGPTGTGVAPIGSPPVEFSSEKNVRWAWTDPGLGFSSPIVWNDTVFVTTAVKNDDPAQPEPEQTSMFGQEGLTAPRQFLLIAIDRESGAERWRRVAVEAVPHEGHHQTLSSFANMSPVTDGERVYVSFGSHGLYAYDFEGTLAWSQNFDVKMRIYNRFGEASSPALWGDTLVLSFDHDGDSFIVAVDKRDGKIRWRREREDEGTNWTSPMILVHEGRAQAVLSGSTFVRGYDLATGEILWQVAGMTRGPIPVPVQGHGMVYLASGTNGQAFKAVKLGPTGDLTGTDAEVWTLNQGVPYNPSPLLWGDEIYLVKEGMRGPTFISALDAKTGAEHYFNARLPAGYVIRASPIGAGNQIYLGTEEGDVLVLRRGPELEVLAINPMGEQILATPAIAGDDLFVRTRGHLYRITAN